LKFGFIVRGIYKRPKDKDGLGFGVWSSLIRSLLLWQPVLLRNGFFGVTSGGIFIKLLLRRTLVSLVIPVSKLDR
jgi:hypothetical protein